MIEFHDFMVITWRIPRTPVTEYERIAQEMNDFIKKGFFPRTYYLVTCQRVILAGFREDFSRILEHPFFQESRNTEHMEVFEGDEAFTHLARVSASLDSLVLGEPQISGQVKQAFHETNKRNAFPQELILIFQFIFKAANQIISRTELQKGKVSFLSLIEKDLFQFSREQWRERDALRIGFLGTGEMAEKSLKLFLKLSNPLRVVFFTKREALLKKPLSFNDGVSHVFQHGVPMDVEKLQEKIRSLEFCAREELFHGSWDFDVLILATHNTTQHPLVTKEDILRVFAKTEEKTRVIIDLGVPRLSDERIRSLAFVRLIQVTDFIKISRENQRKREQAIHDAEVIIQEQLHQLKKKFARLEKRRLLVTFRSHLTKVGDEKKQELLLKIKPPYTPEKIERAFDVFMNSLIHHGQKELENIILENNQVK